MSQNNNNMDWATAGASAFGSLLGGIFGDKNTRDTNAANLQIARENNQTAIDIANKNNELQYQMFNEANEYNSPKHQFEMMKEAGYNPYSLYSNPSSSAASSAPLPSLQQPNLTTPQMMPQTAFANSLQNFAMQSAQVYKTLADAEKSKEETKAARINNESLFARLIAELHAAGLHNEAMEIGNRFQSETFDLRKNALLQENELNNINIAQANQALKQSVFDYQLQAAFGFRLKQKELENLNSLINLNDEKALTEAVQRYAIKKGVSQRDAEIAISSFMANIAKQNADTNFYNAVTSRQVGNAQVGLLNAQTKEQKAYTAFQRPQRELEAFEASFNKILSEKHLSPFILNVKRDIQQFGFNLTTLRIAQQRALQELRNAKTLQETMELRQILDKFDTGIRLFEAVSNSLPRSTKITTHGYNGDDSYGSVTNTTYSGLFGQ